MTSYLLHEGLYRGDAVLERLASTHIAICGAGALGANLAESLARAGAGQLTLVDRDRIEEHNLSTQPWYKADIGSFKARALAAALYRAVGVAATAKSEELTASNARKLLKGAALVVDCFDNSVARAAVKAHCEGSGQPCLHAGMAPEYAEVIWNEHYRVPSDAHDDRCDYPLARNLVMMTVAIAAEVALRWVASEARESYTLTFGDLSIAPWPPGAPAPAG